jgi:orotate phosphoribosyltransferase
MTDAEKKLLQVFTERSFKRGGPFRLASGGTSDYYIDGRMSAVFSESAYLIGEVLYQRTKDLKIDAIGGLEVGAVPLTAATVISYHLHNQKMEGFWVRDKVKDHGTQKLIEGALKPGSRVVIVDDVITRGTSSLKAAQGVQAHGCEVVRVIALVDRLEGAKELLRQNGIEKYEAVFTIRDFGVEPNAPGPAHVAPRS